MLLTNTSATIEEILDREIPERYPSISYATMVPSEWYTQDDRPFVQHGPGEFWEQRLCFLLLIQEALTS